MNRKIAPGDLFEIEKSTRINYMDQESNYMEPGDLVLVLETNSPGYGMCAKAVWNGQVVYLDRDELWWIAKLVN